MCGDFNITVVGLGAIGGSYAMAIRDRLAPRNLWGVDNDQNTLLAAEKMGIINKGYCYPQEPLQKSKFVFICIYPQATVSFMSKNRDSFKPGAIITDTAGLKGFVTRELAGVLRDDVDFIGGHPMAGREGRGLAVASADIFRDAGCYLTPTPHNKPENIKLLKGVLKKIGFSKIIEIDPDGHDDMIAFTSHLPHLVAAALMLNPEAEKKNLCTGGSFRDATRVARINPDLWVELLLANGSNAVKHLERFESDLEGLKDAILRNDRDRLRKLLTLAGQRKEGF